MKFMAEDIASLVRVDAPTLSPDGERVAYVVTRTSRPANGYLSSIWIAATGGSAAPRQLTSGECNDSQPVWSPDGTRLAFTRAVTGPGEGRRNSLCVLPLDGPGETVVAAESTEAFQNPCWSPDGEVIAYASRAGIGAVDRTDAAAASPRRIRGLRSRTDDIGWTVDRPRQIFLADLATGAPPQQVTFGDAEAHDVAWAPDGRYLAFVSARHEDADLDNVDDVWTIQVTRGAAADAPKRITSTNAVFLLPSWSPDGTRIAYYESRGPIGRRLGHRHSQVVIHDLAADTITNLTAGLDRHLTPPAARSPIWRGGRLLVSADDHGRVPLLAVGCDASVERVVDVPQMITGYDATAGVIVFTASGINEQSELYVHRGGTVRQVSHHQPAWAHSVRTERFTVRSEDGCTLDAWLMLPDDLPDPDAPPHGTPLILTIHGGPQFQYGEQWSDDVHLLTSAGFALLYTNPHGSTGGTERFARATLSTVAAETPGTGWGALDFRDVMAVVDTALDRFPGLDPDRLGVIGGSYGGYLTSWIVGHDQRFRAACSERALNNLLSHDWSSDLAGHFRLTTGADPLTHPNELARMSPTSYVDNIHTPLLILHSDEDLRCPPEQADALYVPLRRLGRQVEYWRFPGEGHELSRSGSPAHRMQRAHIILDWFTRWLTPTEEPLDTEAVAARKPEPAAQPAAH